MSTPAVAADRFYRDFATAIEHALSILITEKNLYQRVEVSTAGFADRALSGLNKPDKAEAERVIDHCNKAFWIPLGTNARAEIDHARRIPEGVFFRVPDTKLFCGECDSQHAFNVSGRSHPFDQEGPGMLSDANAPATLQRPPIQTFAFRFQCQSCKGPTEVFLVRREGFKLILCGRSPMATYKAPNVLPKEVKKYFVNAVVAHQAGQTLAGIFLLRTVIEQFAHGFLESGAPRHADAAIDAYMATLESDFNARFPSFRDLYSALSEDMHAATGSPQLFERAKADIIGHFEGRELFARFARRPTS